MIPPALSCSMRLEWYHVFSLTCDDTIYRAWDVESVAQTPPPIDGNVLVRSNFTTSLERSTSFLRSISLSSLTLCCIVSLQWNTSYFATHVLACVPLYHYIYIYHTLYIYTIYSVPLDLARARYSGYWPRMYRSSVISSRVVCLFEWYFGYFMYLFSNIKKNVKSCILKYILLEFPFISISEYQED